MNFKFAKDADLPRSTAEWAVCYNMKDLDFSFTRKGLKLQVLNEKQFRRLVPDLNKQSQNAFECCSALASTAFGERSPPALKFRDMSVYATFLTTQLAKEQYIWKWNEFSHDQSSDLHSDDHVIKDNLYQLMMIWESKIMKITENGRTFLTVYFETPIPESYVRYIHRANNDKKLLLLSLSESMYGGLWCITWIGVNRKVVTCECSGSDADKTAFNVQDNQGNSTLRTDWEVKEALRYSKSEFVTKSIYLEKKRYISPKDLAKNLGRAFFAPVPVMYCSCMNYHLLEVKLNEKSFQADAWYQFRLEEIGNDAGCELYVQDYLSRYGFDMYKSISFPDEITSRNANLQAEMFIRYEKKRHSFMFDYIIEVRKQSEFAAGLKMRYFPFDQQRLALEVSLNTPKANVILRYDDKSGGSTVGKIAEYEESHKKVKRKEIDYIYDDNVLGEEYTILFAEDTHKRPWALIDERKEKSHWKIVFFVLVRRRYSFYLYSALMPLVSIDFSFIVHML